MISFLHTADIHLGLRITRFDKAVVDKLLDARFRTLEKII